MAVEEKLGQNFAEYVVTQVATQVGLCLRFISCLRISHVWCVQVVAGTNFFMKVNVGGGNFIHIRVFRGLPPQQLLELNNAQAGHSADDALNHF